MLFSIIIPVYNVAPYLRECLDSVLAQTFGDWESICVDDGSTDGSGAILDEYAAKDSRFKVIHQTNAGVSAARNRALDEANGEWLTFLDADDLLREDFLSKLLVAAQASKADLAIGGVLRFGINYEDVCVGPSVDGMYSPEDLYIKFNSLCAWACGKIYKMSLWKFIRFPVGIAYSEDRYILHKLLYEFSKIPVVSGSMYRYRMHKDSAYGSSWSPVRLQRRHALEQQLCFFRERGFVRAELFTAGLYFKWVGSDMCNLARMVDADSSLLMELRRAMQSNIEKYWSRFTHAVHARDIEVPFSLGELRILIDSSLSGRSKIPLPKRMWLILKHDGIVAFLRKVIRYSCG